MSPDSASNQHRDECVATRSPLGTRAISLIDGPPVCGFQTTSPVLASAATSRPALVATRTKFPTMRGGPFTSLFAARDVINDQSRRPVLASRHEDNQRDHR